MKAIERFLEKEGFVVLAKNQKEDTFEAWLYKGALDFNTAQPLVFGAGLTPQEAIDSLDAQMITLDI